MQRIFQNHRTPRRGRHTATHQVGHAVDDTSSRRLHRRALWGHGAAALAGLFLAAMALAALRTDNLRMRYERTETIAEESRLREQLRVLQAEVGELRDPARLAQLAVGLSLSRPERVIDRRAPTVSSPPEQP
jgi:hypothetical protein